MRVPTGKRNSASGSKSTPRACPGGRIAPRSGDWLVNRTPSRRWGDVEDLGGAAVFLASEDAGFVTGQNLAVNGGSAFL